MPLSGRGGARATLDLKESIPPPRSAPAAGYRPSGDGCNFSTVSQQAAWFLPAAGGRRAVVKFETPP
jgi:hypothetical protein